MPNKKIIVSVTNDLTTDQRVAKICNTLVESGYEVTLVGRKRSTSKAIDRPYCTKRFRLWFNTGPLFYFNYSLRLYWYLLFNSFDVLWSNDLDTLWPNYAVSKLKDKKLIHDSHEYFTEVPELVNRKRVQRFWKRIEKRILPKLETVFTVSESIAELYRQEYKIKVHVLRNLPELNSYPPAVPALSKEGKKVAIYQGAINLGRGIELMIACMAHCENVILYLIGTGDIVKKVKRLVSEAKLEERVILLGEIPYEELVGYTAQADLGFSWEEDMGLNYRYALPNKVFNYIHAGVPSIVSDLPEMAQLVTSYQVGEVIKSRTPYELSQQVNHLLNDDEKRKTMQSKCLLATRELNWENEKKIMQRIL